jgi:3-dehydroquinate dehydratase/shikimate dehydrogenase
MLFISIPSSDQLLSFLQSSSQIDKTVGFELRLDLFLDIDFNLISDFLKTSSRPVILTVRKKDHGGKFLGSEEDREALILSLLSLNPPFFDLEYDMRPEFIHEVIGKYPKTKWILSYHNFEKTPLDLEAILHLMQEFPAFTYKIAVMALSANDALRALVFAKKYSSLSMICMGEKGIFARVLGPINGNCINYACLTQDQTSAPGQICLHELCDIYHYHLLSQNTAIYGLIGDPISQSLGHIYHNDRFRKMGKDAVYVKMSVTREELSEFIFLAQKLGVQGLSVTMPLKEAIIPFLDDVHDPKIGAVNTVLFKNGKVFGTNTDGYGALDAIEKKGVVRGKTMVILGSGGAARALAFEAQKRGAYVTILNRTLQRAQDLAKAVGCSSGSLDQGPSHYDILVNSSSHCMPIEADQILEKRVVMDVIYHPKETFFLKQALLKGCEVVYGEEMFINQAIGQIAFWFGQ